MAEQNEKAVFVEKIAFALIPIFVLSIGWLVSQVNGFDERIIKLESQTHQLFLPDGRIRSSDESRDARYAMQEHISEKFADVNVRLKLLEERAKAK